jgi:hypothetical protein
LICLFELTRDSWLIYHKLKELEMSLNLLQMLVDTSSGFDNDISALSGNAFGDVWLWEEQVMGVEKIEFEEVPSQKTYGLLQTNIFQVSKPAYNHHTAGRESIKDKPAAATDEKIELMDPRPSAYNKKKTCPSLKMKGINARSTSLVVGHYLADDDPNGEHDAMMVDAHLKLIMFNPNKTKLYSYQETNAEDFISDFIPRKQMKLRFVIEDQNKKWF